MLTKISENWGSHTARETEGCFPCRLDRFFGYYGRHLAEGSGRRYVNEPTVTAASSWSGAFWEKLVIPFVS